MTVKLFSTCKISGLLAALIALGLYGCSEQTAMPEIVDKDSYWDYDPTQRSYSRTQTPKQIITAREVLDSLTGVELIRRSEWASTKLANPQYANPMTTIKRITIHHDGMPPSPINTPDRIRSRIVAIRNSHIRKNWADIGYHFIVDPLGRVWEGRPLKYQGAHVKDHNEGNIGVMVLGNYQVDQPTDKALNSLFKLIRCLMAEYRVTTKRVFTHQELIHGGCPGGNLQAKIDLARKPGGQLSN